MPLTSRIVNHPHGKELEEISRILDSKPTIVDIAYQDLTKGGNGNAVGAKGMTAEQVVRAAIVKQMNVGADIPPRPEYKIPPYF